MFDALDFITELTQHIPPRGVQLIRRYRLYSSRIKGCWSEMVYVVERAPNGWKASREVVADDPENLGFEPLSASETVEVDADYRSKHGRAFWRRSTKSTRLFVRSADPK